MQATVHVVTKKTGNGRHESRPYPSTVQSRVQVFAVPTELEWNYVYRGELEWYPRPRLRGYPSLSPPPPPCIIMASGDSYNDV